MTSRRMVSKRIGVRARTCEALGSAPARTMMVGDSSNDARAARAAGCPVVLVTYGYNHGEPIRSADDDAYVDRIVHTSIPIREAPEVSGQPEEMRALLEALSPVERREIISRRDSDFNIKGEAHEQRDPLTDL